MQAFCCQGLAWFPQVLRIPTTRLVAKSSCWACSIRPAEFLPRCELRINACRAQGSQGPLADKRQRRAIPCLPPSWIPPPPISRRDKEGIHPQVRVQMLTLQIAKPPKTTSSESVRL